ncbi:MAG: hypothetical protein ABEL76_06360 [Bradymonadaceae bacterium]
MQIDRYRLTVVACCLCLMAACSSDGGSPGGGNGAGPDAGPPGDAADVEQPDATADGSADADQMPDGGGPACTYFPDSCPEGKNCYGNPSGRGCATFDPDKQLGDSCEKTNECNDGHRCFEKTCRAICNPDDLKNYGCPESDACIPLQSEGGERLEWGVCVKKEDKCKPWPNDDCGEGKNCYQFSYGLRCRAYDGKASAGDTCTGSSDCNAGQICVRAPDAEQSRCRNKCDDKHPCEKGSCRELRDVDFGACFPSSS